jgi:hypothetical protein
MLPLGYLTDKKLRRGRYWYHSNEMKNWHAHLSVGLDHPPANLPPKAGIVGYLGLSGHSISARNPLESPIEVPLDMSNSCSKLQFRAEPGNQLSGGNVIWHETLTVLMRGIYSQMQESLTACKLSASAMLFVSVLELQRRTLCLEGIRVV